MSLAAAFEASVRDASRADAAGVSAVVLAAGLSSRMSGAFKTLMDVGGVPMIRRTVSNVLEFGPAEAVVVTGHRAEEVEAALAGLPVRFAFNPDHAQGQSTSVAAGVRALGRPCRAVMVVLGDQPLVTADRLRDLARAFDGLEGGASILVPQHGGQRGNPVVFAAWRIPEVAGGGINVGCRRLTETEGEAVRRVAFDSDAYTFDCDTQEDYARLLARLEGGAP